MDALPCQPGKAAGFHGLRGNAQGVGALHEGLGANGLLDGLRESGVFCAAATQASRVACASAAAASGCACRCCFSQDRLNRSRPVLLGAGRAK